MVRAWEDNGSLTIARFFVWVSRVSTRLCCFKRCYCFLKRGRSITTLAVSSLVRCIVRLVVVAGAVGQVCARSRVNRKHATALVVVWWLMPLSPTNLVLWTVGVCVVMKRSGRRRPKTREFPRLSRMMVRPGLSESVWGSALLMRPFSFSGSAVIEVARESVQARKKRR